MAVLVLPTLLLITGFITDYRARKVYNWMILAGFAFGIIHCLYFDGTSGLLQGLGSLGLALLLSLPLVLLGVLGAGDMKLLAVFGLSTSVGAVINVFIYSFAWAALFGFIYALLNKQLGQVFKNMWAITKGEKPQSEKLHRIPFTLPILLAWGTYVLSLRGGL